MGLAQYAPYLEFLAYGERALRSDNPQLGNPSAPSSLQWYQVDDVAKVCFQFLGNEVPDFLVGVLYGPAVEVGRFLVVVVEHLREHLPVGGVAEGVGRSPYPFLGVLLYGEVGQSVLVAVVGYGLEVALRRVFPAELELLGSSSAAFGEARVADVSF